MNIREDKLRVKMPRKPAARLTQRRYDDDPEVRDRAPARGENWVPPLGPGREGGALEAPEFDDALDEDDEPDSPDAVESGRAPGGGQDDDEATAGASADVTEEPDANEADALFSAAVPDR